MNAPSPVSGSPQLRVFVFSDGRCSRYRAGRTVRALRAGGIPAEDVTGHTPAMLAGALAAAAGPLWLLGAGAWPATEAPFAAPPPSDTGLPLCAVGLVVAEPGRQRDPDEDARAWARLQSETGGDLDRDGSLSTRLPRLASVYLEPPAVASLAGRLAAGEPWPGALRAELAAERRRVVRVPALDVHCDPSLRIAQIVTSLQQGGAERIALDLHQAASHRGLRSLLVTLGRPTRAAFPPPPGTVDVSAAGTSRQERVRAAADAAARFAADLVHGHLLEAEDVSRLAASEVPLVLTIHNARPGWPQGLATLQPKDAALLIACSQAVESDLRAARIPVPVRTVWNGIDFGRFERTPDLERAAEECRKRLGIRADDFVLLALANPRPQKRLEILPAILAATRAELARRGIARDARLVVAGEASHASAAAVGSEAALLAAIVASGLGGRVDLVGAAADVAPLVAAASVLVSCSAYEGLSLAQLEAIAAGLPVVATAVGGSPEIANDNPAMFLLPPQAGPEEYAVLLADVARRPPEPGGSAAAVHFSRPRMVEGYSRLYPRAIEASRGRGPGDGLWLVANNFSTGGAQSSARRLLLELAGKGIRVRAAVLEEQTDWPTPGRRALSAAGIPVLALPPAGTVDPAEAVSLLMESIDADRPRAVVLWNAITQYKILLADSLLDVPLYDVSPGEMYFDSLEKYFRNPRPGLPYRTPRQYGARLSGVIVKYRAEGAQAAEWLGAPVHVVPNGVPLGPSPAERPPRDRLVIGTAARISPQKKIEQLLLAIREADSRLPAHVLRIAGGVERGCADYAEHLRRLADGLPVEWLGELHDLRSFLQDLDLFAMISEPAGCPNASLEAMAAGLPVVATDAGGAAEQVVDGVTGRLVPRDDTPALADALVDQARDPRRLARCGAAGRARAEELFDEKRMIEDYCRILLRATASGQEKTGQVR